MKIIDNFLTKTYHKDILELMSGETFKWCYSNNLSFSDFSKNINDYGFSHSFWDENKGTTDEFSLLIKPLLYQILDVTDCDLILRARGDMVTWTGRDEFKLPAHVDYPFPNTAAVLYINETDGDTIFYNVKPNDVSKNEELKEYDRVSPKANRLILFDGDLLHTGSSPIKYKNRILINSNYIKNEYVEEFKIYLRNKYG